MEFLEAPAFTHEYRELQNRLAAAPELEALGREWEDFGSFVDPRRGKGRRGGLRVIYYYSHASARDRPYRKR